MRFYNIEDKDDIQRLDSLELFPNREEEVGVRKCLDMGLVPSVTSVLGIIRESYLEKWFMREAIDIFKEKGGEPKESVDEVFSRESPNAIFGTGCHAVGEAWMNKEKIEVEEEIKKHAQPLIDWFDKHVKRPIFAERLLGSHSLGTAGSADFAFEDHAGRLVLADLKVVKFSFKFPPKPGLGYRAQLAAYKEMLKQSTGEDFQPLSLYLASPFGWDKKPDMRVFEYGDKDYLPAFKAARKLWEEHAALEPLQCVNPTKLPAALGTWEPKKRK